MKKLIIVSIIIHILTLVITFFALSSASFIYAVIFAVLAIFELVPLFAILSCLDSSEQNTADISYLYTKIKKLENTTQEYIPEYSTAIKHHDSPNKSWKCLKCDTINKPEDSVCSNCKCEYSYNNPTYDSEPKRKSRFIKFK